MNEQTNSNAPAISGRWTLDEIEEFRRQWFGLMERAPMTKLDGMLWRNTSDGLLYRCVDGEWELQLAVTCRCGHEWAHHDFLGSSGCNVSVWKGNDSDNRCECVAASLDLYALVFAIRLECVWRMTTGDFAAEAARAMVERFDRHRPITRETWCMNFQRLDCERHLMKDFSNGN